MNGKHYVYGITDKIFGGDRHFVKVGHSFPSSLPPETSDACAAVAVASLDAVGFSIGAAHIEVKIDEEEPKLIEINGRPGGDRIPDLVAMVTGHDPVVDHVHAFLGAGLEVPNSTLKRQSGAAISFFHATPGTIRSIVGVDDIPYTKDVKEVV